MMLSMQLLIGVPFLSLGIVLSALSTMAPQHRLSWLWRTVCLIAALPPLIVSVPFPNKAGLLDGTLSGVFIVALLLSAPVAATASVAVALRQRRAG